jgi:hypothetical protein
MPSPLLLLALAQVTAPAPSAAPAPAAPSPAAVPTAAPAAAEAPAATLHVQASTANVRAQPSASAALVGTPRIGTACASLGAADGGWARVDCGGVQGWVKAELLAPERPDAARLLASARDAALPVKERLQAATRLLALGGPEADALAPEVHALFVQHDVATLRESRGTRRFKARAVKLTACPPPEKAARALAEAVLPDAHGYSRVALDGATGDFLAVGAVHGGELRVVGGTARLEPARCPVTVEMDYRGKVDRSLEVALLGQEVPPPEERPARTPDQEALAKVAGHWVAVVENTTGRGGAYLRACETPRSFSVYDGGFRLGRLSVDAGPDSNEHALQGASDLGDDTVRLSYRRLDGREASVTLEYPAFREGRQTLGRFTTEDGRQLLFMGSDAGYRLREDRSCPSHEEG